MNKEHNPYAGKIIVVSIPKVGVGKSALSMNIAPDVDPDVFYDADLIPAITTFNNFREDDKKWNVIRLKNGVDSAEKFAADLMDAKEKGLTVLVDCGGFDSAITRTAVAAADLILSPFHDDPSDILGLIEFSQVLEEISIKMGKTLKAHIVMNKVHPSRSNFRDLDDYLKQFSNLERLDTAIPLDKSIPAKFGEGLGIVEHLTTRHGRAGNAMRSLFLDMRKALDEVQ
ncbi:TPA: ParA family protein [Enterobacter roggenkampii]